MTPARPWLLLAVALYLVGVGLHSPFFGALAGLLLARAVEVERECRRRAKVIGYDASTSTLTVSSIPDLRAGDVIQFRKP